ncbi:MAG: LysR family transcriptional regulator [Polyangiaceae bacterium]|nr:LysR family transcriptional regulator [Polyangiaceae bacterium]
MDISWEDARLFLTVADNKSISDAAKILRVAQPTVTRRLADLEALLGEPLFVRSARGTALTAFGERLVIPARHMAEWATEFAHAAERADASPRGVVRITALPAVAFDLVAPFAAVLREELPEVRLEVLSTVRYLDVARGEADLALRTQKPEHKELVTLASIETHAAPFATPSYIKKLPKRPRAADVDWIGWAPPYDEFPPNPALARLIPGFRPVFATDDFLVQVRAAEAGLGAILLGRLRHRFSRESPLVEIKLEDLPPFPGGIHLVCAKSAQAVPRIRAVAELIMREMKSASGALRDASAREAPWSPHAGRRARHR